MRCTVYVKIKWTHDVDDNEKLRCMHVVCIRVAYLKTLTLTRVRHDAVTNALSFCPQVEPN